MKIMTKRFLVAVSLLVVSAMLLASASFAWFSMNTEVDVDGIEVEAYSDALFLEIASTNEDSAFDISTTLNEGKKALRLVTNKFTDTVTIVKIAATLLDETAGEYTGGVYYVKADSDVTGGKDNFVLATDLELPSSTAGLYKIAFTRVTYGEAYDEENDVDTDFYAKDLATNSFTLVTGLEDGENISGYYTADIEEQEDDDVYESQYDYYSLSGTTYTIVGNLHEGTSLAGYYTVEEVVDPAPEEEEEEEEIETTEGDPTTGEEEEEEEEEETVTPEPYYYVKNAVGNNYEYSCLGYSVDADLEDAPAFFWGRAYADALGQVQGTNTLNILGERDLPAYVYHDTVYLRSAENTNPGQNLRIESVKVGGRANDLSAALRILFVATNGKGEVVYTTYDNGNVSAFNGALFSSILGDRGEVVTVDMYVYFDGTDDVAKTLKDAEAGVLNGQTIEVKFAINGPAYND